MTIDFAKDRPIYLQLVEMICGEVIKGSLQPGDKLPSVREYALETGVNMNTVQRVYKELETMNLLEMKRGQGSFITTDTVVIYQIREQLKEQVSLSFLASIDSFGFTLDEMIEVLKKKGGN